MKAYWHVHHDTLLEFSADIEERIDYIKAHKPKREQELRLRLLKEVQGKLPATVIEAWAAYDKARAAYNKAGAAYDKARAAYNKAGAAYEKAWAAYDKAIADNLPAIEALHAQECPGCPWDGKTIFPGKGD